MNQSDSLEIQSALCELAYQPVFITKSGAVSLHGAIAELRSNASLELPKPDALTHLADVAVTVEQEYMPYGARVGNVAVISVTGSLVHTPGRAFSYSWFTSYQGVTNNVNQALLDHRVDTIAMVYHTGGGVAHGMFDCADSIREARSEKRIVGISNDVAASAGYGLISASSEIILTQSGEVGSIGVRTMHVSIEQMLKDSGIKVTEVYAGEHKVDLSMYHDLTEKQQARLQEDINDNYTRFVDLVHANRDSLSTKAIKATKAQMYRAEKAVDAGLADRVDSLGGALASLIKTPQPGNSTQRENSFMKLSNAGPADGQTPEQIQAAANTAAMDRMNKVMAHPKFEANTAVAKQLLSTSLSADEICATLDASAAAPAPVTPTPDAAAAAANADAPDPRKVHLDALGFTEAKMDAAMSLLQLNADLGAGNPETPSGSRGTGDRPESSGNELLDAANAEKAPTDFDVAQDSPYASRNATMQETNIIKRPNPLAAATAA